MKNSQGINNNDYNNNNNIFHEINKCIILFSSSKKFLF